MHPEIIVLRAQGARQLYVEFAHKLDWYIEIGRIAQRRSRARKARHPTCSCFRVVSEGQSLASPYPILLSSPLLAKSCSIHSKKAAWLHMEPLQAGLTCLTMADDEGVCLCNTSPLLPALAPGFVI